MRAYVLKRLLLMIPTFFGISLVVFVVMNLAPGRPGGAQATQDLSASVTGADSQESYRIFREQFGLDRPVLFNTRIWLGQDDVERALHDLAGRGGATAKHCRSALRHIPRWTGTPTRQTLLATGYSLTHSPAFPATRIRRSRYRADRVNI